MIRNLPPNVNMRAIGPALLYVNATWCGYCKETRPTIEKVAGVLGSIVPVYNVDSEADADVAKALGVKSYPTILYVTEGGAVVPFKGSSRTLDTITSFVCNNSAERHQFCRRIR